MVAIGYRGPGDGQATTDMTGGTSGGNIFFVGDGATSITGGAGGDVYIELTGGPKTVTIANFVSGLDPFDQPVANPDMISLAMPGGGDYQLVPGAGASVTANQASYSYIPINGGISTEVQFGDGATWTLVNAVLHESDFT